MNKFGIDLTKQIVVYQHPRTNQKILVVCIDGSGCMPQTKGTKIRIYALRCQDDSFIREIGGMIRSSEIIRIATREEIDQDTKKQIKENEEAKKILKKQVKNSRFKKGVCNDVSSKKQRNSN